ncbi:alpha/beta fold hydrolase [Paracoccaceae bacterium GXU_MW_L88]
MIERTAPTLPVPTEKIVEVGGTRFNMLERGTGPTILLLAGITGDHRFFDYGLIDNLAENYHVVALDRPGWGQSMTDNSRMQGNALQQQSAQIAELIRAQDWGQPLIVGHSMGAVIALDIAINHKELPRALALISPLTVPNGEIPPSFRPLVIDSPMLRRFLAEFFLVPALRLRETKSLEMLFSPDEVPDELRKKGGAVVGMSAKYANQAMVEMASSVDELNLTQEKVAAIRCPIGLMFGSEDGVLDRDQQGITLAEKQPNIDFQLIYGAGHMLPITRIKEVADFVRKMDTRAHGGPFYPGSSDDTILS